MIIQGVELQVGDSVRCLSDDWEGRIVDLDELNQVISLEMFASGLIRGVAPDDVILNLWDPRLS